MKINKDLINAKELNVYDSSPHSVGIWLNGSDIKRYTNNGWQVQSGETEKSFDLPDLGRILSLTGTFVTSGGLITPVTDWRADRINNVLYINTTGHSGHWGSFTIEYN